MHSTGVCVYVCVCAAKEGEQEWAVGQAAHVLQPRQRQLFDLLRPPPRLVDRLVDLPSHCGNWVGKVPARMWHGGEPSPGADVAGASPVPVQMWQR